MEDWKECKLSDIADVTMGQSPESIYYNSNKEGMPFLQGNRTFGYKFPTFDTYTTFVTKVAQKEDVIMSVRAPVGELNIAPEKLCLGRGVCSIRMKNNEQMFLYYLMKANRKQLLNKENGTVFGSVNRNDIANLTIHLPPLPTQQKIAQILSSLDDKIELNNKINANLEQQAQALFKSWFVDFEPFGGEMPAGWKVGKLSEIAEITSGKRPPMKQLDLSKDVQIPLVGAASVMGYTNSVLYNEPILITGRVGTHGVIQRFNTECWPSDNTLVVKSHYYEYTYQIMCNIDYSNMNRGSTQPLITQSDLGKVECLIPAGNELEKFEKLVNILFNKIDANLEENKKLSNLRDTLLPKLMNGEVEI